MKNCKIIWLRICRKVMLTPFCLWATLSCASSALGFSDESSGIFFTSFGDVDSEAELEGYLKNAAKDPDLISFPWLFKPLKSVFAEYSWQKRKKQIKEELQNIGGTTRYRHHTEEQISQVIESLSRKEKVAHASYGYNFLQPYTNEGLKELKNKGVTEIITLDHSPQYSGATAGLAHRNIRVYLAAQKDWKPKITAIASYATDPRYISLIEQKLKSTINEKFPGTPPQDICLFFPSHGVPEFMIRNGDPAYKQMMVVYEELRRRFKDYDVSYGFENHTYIPIRWTSPDGMTVAKNIAASSCRNVIIDPRISFTVDCLETLAHFREMGEKIKELAPEKQVFVLPAFNDDPDFAEFLSTIILEASEGKGDIIQLN